jgi:hypothetical protein
VTRAPLRSPPWLRYRDPFRELDERSNLFADVSRCLPSHQPWFAPATRGALFDANGRDWSSEHGIACWIAPRLAVTERVQGFVHGRFRRDGWGEEPVPRTMQVMRVEDPATGRTVAVGDLYGLRYPQGKGDVPARAIQARRARALVDALAGPGEGIVLGGDLKILPGAETFGILAGAGLHDLVQASGIEDTPTRLYDKDERHADYMLVNDAVQVLSFHVPAEPVLSDHRFMSLTIAMCD